MGRSMVLGKGACHKRKRKLPSAELERMKVLSNTEGPFRCTNCPQVKTEAVKQEEGNGVGDQELPLSNVFYSKEKFHAHVLECGGDKDWDSSAKRAKKEKKSKNKDAPARKIGKNLIFIGFPRKKPVVKFTRIMVFTRVWPANKGILD